MRLAVVEGVAVPAVLATSFADPRKRPFSYTHPLPPSVDHRTSKSVSIPKVLPILAPSLSSSLPSDMPSNIQYNSPMPIYSRESAEEQYKRQYGTGPDVALGASDKHFDPLKSETLKVLNAGVNDDIGTHFFEKVAEAEAPHVPIIQEPSWTEVARRKADRARSASPSATPQAPIALPLRTHAASIGPPSYKREYVSRGKGYEFGGLDYTDRMRVPRTDDYYYVQPHEYRKEEKRAQPGYEMGGMDYRKTAEVGASGPYRGHGPEYPKLHAKAGVSLRRNEMNIEIAPNVDQVSSDVLVGDTLSNQKISKNQQHQQWSQFGTVFGPTKGFTKEHIAVQRAGEPSRSTTLNVSAKDYAPPSEARVAHYDGYNVSSTNGYSRESEGYQPTASRAGYQHEARSQSAAPLERYQWNTTNEKEVTIETLLNDKALIPTKQSVAPEWHTKSLDKHNRWMNRSDPRLTRTQIYSHEPNWSRTVSERRNAWESQARDTDARLQQPASTKITPQQPPHWYRRADQTHTTWQNIADRQSTERQQDQSIEPKRYEQQHYSTDVNRAQQDNYTTQLEYGVPSARRDYSYQTEKREYSLPLEKREQSLSSSQQKAIPLGYEVSPWHKQTSYAAHETSKYSSDTTAPTSQAYTQSYGALPVSTSHTQSEQRTSNTADGAQTIRQFDKVESMRTSDSRYEKVQHDTSMEKTSIHPYGTGSSTFGSDQSSRQAGKTYTTALAPATARYVGSNEQQETYTGTSTSQRTGGGVEFTAKSEMAEVLPRGSIANTVANTEGKYLDREGHNVNYKRELVTSVDPNRECSLIKEEEQRIIEKPLEPGVISRHVTTKYYKKKTVTDTTTTTTSAP